MIFYNDLGHRLARSTIYLLALIVNMIQQKPLTKNLSHISYNYDKIGYNSNV